MHNAGNEYCTDAKPHANFGMSKTVVMLAWLALAYLAGTFGTLATASPLQASNSVSVFVLAGQSNMQGQAVVDLDDPENYNGGQGTLKKLLEARPKQFGHLQDENGQWKVRDDVFVRYKTEAAAKTGGLSIGYTAYDGQHHFGPELQYGHVVGQRMKQPVLLLKTAWGGKSIYKDFRPPSSGGTTGPYFTKMIQEIKEGMKGVATEFPALKDRTPKLEGFVWIQGWNDMVDETARIEYEKNLINLISDVRKELDAHDLPVVIGELGTDGAKASKPIKQIRAAQKAVAENAKFKDRVTFVPTARFARAKDKSPNVEHGHHWYGNAESYFLVGDAMGTEMLTLLDRKTARKRVLIIGDSISMGYTRPVRAQLKSKAVVLRPTENCKGTKNGVGKIEEWVAMRGGQFDLIHFNFGLHDLKHVHPKTRANSNDPNHPPQSTIEEYETQLQEIVAVLKKTGARLIFATTTPVPKGVKPFRDPASPGRYNEVALKIMKQHEIAINDLFEFCKARPELQKPVNVHFKQKGSVELAKVVAAEIDKLLDEVQK